MSKHWKKSFHPSLVPLSSHTVPLSLYFFSSFLPLLFLVWCLTFAQGRMAVGEQQRTKMTRIDRFIVGYHLQGALDKFWIPLTVQVPLTILPFPFIPCDRLHEWCSSLSMTDSTREKIKKSFLIYRQSIIMLSLKGAYIMNIAIVVGVPKSIVFKLSCCKEIIYNRV